VQSTERVKQSERGGERKEEGGGDLWGTFGSAIDRMWALPCQRTNDEINIAHLFCDKSVIFVLLIFE
jgi:hypothetical protein